MSLHAHDRPPSEYSYLVRTLDKEECQIVIDKPRTVSYREIVKELSLADTDYSIADQNEEVSEILMLPEDAIPLTQEEKQRIYNPWHHSIIIKVVGGKFNDQYLKTKLADLWKIQEVFPLTDLGMDFYTAKFNREEIQRKVLQQGP